MKTLDTKMLWRAWRDRGDEVAFRDLVVREVPYAADLVRRHGASAAEADDAVQEALVKLAQEPSDLPVTVGIRAWLCRRGILAFRMYVRASGRRRAYEAAATSAGSTGDPTTPTELRETVNAALADLAPKHRHPVMLRFLYDLDYREMAHVLGISRNACRLRVFKGLRALRQRLGGDAPAMLALVGVPPILNTIVPAALASPALSGAGGVTGGTGSGIAVGVKVAIAAGLATVAIGSVLLTRPAVPERPAAPPVAVLKPPPSAPPPSAPVVPRDTSRALTLLDEHLAARQDATETLWDVQALDDLIGPAQGTTVRVDDPSASLDLNAVPGSTARIQLGAGTYHLEGRLPTSEHPFELVGAGLGKTTVIVGRLAPIGANQRLPGLRFRDLTIEGGTILDVRGRAAGLFQRVRFRSWQDRAGFGAPVGIAGAALLAFDECEFVGGVKRPPGGSALSLRGAALLMFRRCIFADVSEVLSSSSRTPPHLRSAVHFDDCIFEAARVVRSDDRAEGSYPIRLRQGEIRYGLQRASAEARRLAVGGERLIVAPDVGMKAEPARCTLAEVRGALANYTAPVNERVIAIEARTHRGDATPLYVVHLQHGRATHRARLIDGAGLVLPNDDHVLGRRPAFRPGRGATLRELLEDAWPGLDGAEPVGGVALHSMTDGSPEIRILDRFGRGRR